MGTSSLLHPELGTLRLSMLAQLSEEVMRLRTAGEVFSFCAILRAFEAVASNSHFNF